MLPEALIPFVVKRLRSGLTGHWHFDTAERLENLELDSIGNIAWDQAALLNASHVRFHWVTM